MEDNQPCQEGSYQGKERHFRTGQEVITIV